MIIIDAKKAVLGRLAATASKLALKGEEVIILNCEKVVVAGTKPNILAKYHRKRTMGDPLHGPYFPRQPNQIVKRTIRGMVPYKQEKGLKAYNKIRCYKGIPDQFKDKKLEVIQETKLKNATKYLTLEQISALI
ncbi:MAG: 50S ribosomal protein L13 [Candidatus Nanoarchaeia archaeon]|nr:50S ribosomal protein L13 [Candidatus Nanoarchaeia archaeon]